MCSRRSRRTSSTDEERVFSLRSPALKRFRALPYAVLMIAFGCSHDNVSGPLTSGFTPSLAPDFFSQPQSPHTASCDRSRRSGLNACGPRFFVAIDTTADVFRKFPTPSALSHIVSESSVRANSIRGYSTPINSFVGQVGEPVALGVDTDQGTPSNCVFEDAYPQTRSHRIQHPSPWGNMLPRSRLPVVILSFSIP